MKKDRFCRFFSFLTKPCQAHHKTKMITFALCLKTRLEPDCLPLTGKMAE